MDTYKNIDGWFSDEDCSKYRELITSLPDNSIMAELGVWKGRSITSIADLVISKNLSVFAVDTFQGSENEKAAHIEAKTRDLYEEFYNNLKASNIQNNVVIYRTTTDKAFEIFKQDDIFFDLVFIDADHSVNAVSKDIKNYYTLLKNNNSILAGHDFSWFSVKEALEKTIPIRTYLFSDKNMWWIKKEDFLLKNESSTVTAVVCTKDRYDILYNTLLCIVNQTKKPEYLLIYDDSNIKTDLTSDFKWYSLFTILNKSGIDWKFINTTNHGQNKNHQNSVEVAKSKYIWRVDDDIVMENTVLENLFNIIKEDPKIGAVAPRVLMPNNSLLFNEVSGKIEDIFNKAGLQLCIDGKGQHEVEHLHCSFIFDRTIPIKYYHDKLSMVGHREESIVSHRIFKAGYKLIVDLDTEIYHCKASSGGIRSTEVTNEMFENDERLFREELEVTDYQELSNQVDKTFFGYFNSGIGDHFVFKQLLKDIQNKYDRIILAVCYPTVFWDILNIELISLEEGKKIIKEQGKKEENFSVYHVMERYKEEFSKIDENFILQAYKKLYL